MYLLGDDVTSIKYVGSVKGKVLIDSGIHYVQDLLNYFPYKYRDTTKVLSVQEVVNVAQQAPLFTKLTTPFTFVGLVESSKMIMTKYRKTICEVYLQDVSTHGYSIKAIWFNQPYVHTALKEGKTALFFGKISIKGSQILFYNPEFEITSETKKNIHLGRVTPVYRKVKTISTSYFRRFLEQLRGTESQYEEFIPGDLLRQESLVPLQTAYKYIHFPESEKEVQEGYMRLAIQELLELHRKFIELNPVSTEKSPKVTMPMASVQKILNEWKGKLPYTLTDSQEKAVNTLVRSMLFSKIAQDIFMYGDVGSGKTVVCAIISALYVMVGYAVVFMAPTTILAEQHFKRFLEFFSLWGIPSDKISLITSARKKVSTKPDGVIIGTHALLFQKIENASNVALLIIDEQHRFGVKQREALRQRFDAKKNVLPHVLSLSATPIPRTLAQSYYGFSESIYLTEKPHTSDNIKTRIVPEQKIDDLYSWIVSQVREQKSQVFLVFPLIEESESLQGSGLKEMFMMLSESIFKGLRCGLLHGKMKESEKLAVMNDFEQKNYDILFSTPVIEVGIDIVNAHVMVIHNAERFGLAQLHQLRGRIGRDGEPSFCFLTFAGQNDSSVNRLEYFCHHENGLDLATYDLENRGPGEVYGTMQAGFARLRIADASNFNLIKKSVEIYKSLEAQKILPPFYIMDDTE